jgi:ankyrin repeat protein
VNAADSYGITPLMVAANMGEIPIIQYLIDRGADLGAHDLGNKEAVKLMTRAIQDRGIKHITSELARIHLFQRQRRSQNRDARVDPEAV